MGILILKIKSKAKHQTKKCTALLFSTMDSSLPSPLHSVKLSSQPGTPLSLVLPSSQPPDLLDLDILEILISADTLDSAMEDSDTLDSAMEDSDTLDSDTEDSDTHMEDLESPPHLD